MQILYEGNGSEHWLRQANIRHHVYVHHTVNHTYF